MKWGRAVGLLLLKKIRNYSTQEEPYTAYMTTIKVHELPFF